MTISPTTTSCLPWESEAIATLAHRVAANTARGIVEQRRPPGELITEVDLARDEGVSRTPAREAMLQLESWGLVRLMPKKGAIVTSETTNQRHDLLQVRAMFEIEAVATLAGSGRFEGVALSLESALASQRDALGRGDLLAFASADYLFHASVIVAGGNAVVAGLLEQLAPRLARLTHQVCLDRPETLPLLLAEHETLARQARAGDAEGFGETARRHIRDTHFPEEARHA